MAATAGDGDFSLCVPGWAVAEGGWDHEVKNVSVLVAIAGSGTATGPAVPRAE